MPDKEIPGVSRFYVSMEDDFMRLFANRGVMSRMLEKSFADNEILEHGSLDWSIQNAQKKSNNRIILFVSGSFNMMMCSKTKRNSFIPFGTILWRKKIRVRFY